MGAFYRGMGISPRIYHGFVPGATEVLFALLHSDRTETFSTDFLCDYYDIDRTSDPRHDALGDARLIARIFQAELGEMRRRGLATLAAEDLRVKRFVAPPLR
jgi:DNA polymerase III epsilon subunit-like protein